jgi:hypothetical protein
MDPVSLFGGFLLNLAVAVLIVRGIFYPVKHDKNYVFTYLAFSTTIYFVVASITTAEVGIGVGFGLFAIFSVLRYRAAAVSAREMTYLFILIALPVMNSVLMRTGDWLNLLGANVAIVAVIFMLEKGWGFRYEAAQRLRYDRVDLVKPENRVLLIEDLRERTGLPIKRVEVLRIDLLDDTARLRVYYDQSSSQFWSVEDDLAANDD